MCDRPRYCKVNLNVSNTVCVTELRSSGLLRSEWWPFLPDVSGQPIGPIFKGQESRSGPIGSPETSVRNYNYALRNSPEERSYHILNGGSLKSRAVSVSSIIKFDVKNQS